MSTSAYGQRLRAARLAAGLTQQQAAEQVAVSTSFWCDLEHGLRTPATGTAARILQHFNVLTDEEQRLHDAIHAERQRCRQIAIRIAQECGSATTGRLIATAIAEGVAV